MDEKPTIELSDDGSIIIKNLSNLTDSNNEKLDEKQMQVLCRCGSSKNKPFCDGTHKKVGFSDE